MDVSRKAALEAIMRLANDAEMQVFHSKARNGPLLYILIKAKRDAVDALVALSKTDPSETEHVRKLQNEVQRFNDMVTWVVEIMTRGDEAYLELQADAQEAEAVREVIRSQIDEQGEDE